MKNVCLAFVAMVLAYSSVEAQQKESDFQQVVQTLTYYLEGGTNNDFETLKRAFHETATMKFIGDSYKEVNAIEFFQKGMKPGPKQDRQTEIIDVQIQGNAASARLKITYPTFSFFDFMNLLKIDGQWKIVNKIFYRQAHESE
ncbi:MAG: nuclear transport factor 2 family protein [Bacteroidota bacterium]